MTTWRQVLESKATTISRKQAAVKLTEIAAASPEHAEAIRDVLHLLAGYSALGMLVNMTADPKNAENMAHNARIAAAKVEELDPAPKGDY